MTIIPSQNNLLIRMRDFAATGDNVIALPDQVDKANTMRYPYGEVLAVGPDCKFCAVDDKVLFLAGNAIGFEHPTAPVYIIPETCVLGKYVLDEKQSVA